MTEVERLLDELRGFSERDDIPRQLQERARRTYDEALQLLELPRRIVAMATDVTRTNIADLRFLVDHAASAQEKATYLKAAELYEQHLEKMTGASAAREIPRSSHSGTTPDLKRRRQIRSECWHRQEDLARWADAMGRQQRAMAREARR